MISPDFEEEPRPSARPPCSIHERDAASVVSPLSQSGTRQPPGRLLPQRLLPAYAYLPGRFPHPIRHPQGHSYHATGRSPASGQADPDELLWGMDLFNQGFYWEAHEAWEGLWRAAERGSAEHNLLQGLILLAATGVKLRERKRGAARRHGSRAAAFFSRSANHPVAGLERSLGHPAARLALLAGDVDAQIERGADIRLAFDFVLGF